MKRVIKKMPKPRNPVASLVRDPSGPFRPKVIPNKIDKPVGRKRKHKGGDYL